MTEPHRLDAQSDGSATPGSATPEELATEAGEDQSKLTGVPETEPASGTEPRNPTKRPTKRMSANLAQQTRLNPTIRKRVSRAQSRSRSTPPPSRWVGPL